MCTRSFNDSLINELLGYRCSEFVEQCRASVLVFVVFLRAHAQF